MHKMIRAFDGVIVFLLGLLVFISIAGVFMRYVLNTPLHWAEEVSGLLMIWIVFIGVVVAERDGENLTIDFLVNSFPLNIKLIFNVFIVILSFFILMITSWWAIGLIKSVSVRETRILNISFIWMYIPVVIGFFSTAFLMVNKVFIKNKKIGEGEL